MIWILKLRRTLSLRLSIHVVKFCDFHCMMQIIKENMMQLGMHSSIWKMCCQDSPESMPWGCTNSHRSVTVHFVAMSQGMWTAICQPCTTMSIHFLLIQPYHPLHVTVQNALPISLVRNLHIWCYFVLSDEETLPHTQVKTLCLQVEYYIMKNHYSNFFIR